MAEYLFKKMAKEEGLEIQSSSAGFVGHSSRGATFETLEALKKEGIDASEHKSRPLSEELIQEADLVCVMTKSHEFHLLDEYPHASSKLYLLSNFYEGEDKALIESGIPDPIGMGEEFYRKVFEAVQISLREFVNALKANL